MRSGQCLKGFHDQVNRDSAKSQCEKLGVRLVSMRAQEQADAVLDYTRHIANGKLLNFFLKTQRGALRAGDLLSISWSFEGN